MHKTAESAFLAAYNGDRNFMTPRIHRRGAAGDYFYELSSGSWINGRIYGVTVLTRAGERCRDLNKRFDTAEEAEAHIASLKSSTTGE